MNTDVSKVLTISQSTHLFAPSELFFGNKDDDQWRVRNGRYSVLKKARHIKSFVVCLTILFVR